MLDEFLGGVGGGADFLGKLRGARRGRSRRALRARAQICVRTARYTFNHVEGRGGQGRLAPAKSEGLPRRMAQTSGPRRNQGVISAYLRYE